LNGRAAGEQRSFLLQSFAGAGLSRSYFKPTLSRKTMRSAVRRTIEIAFATLAFTACHDSTGPAGPPTLSLRDTTLLVDETLSVPVTARNADGRPLTDPSLSWSSSAPAVALVDDSGHVTAVALGTATITATLDSVEARMALTVAPQFTQIATGETHTCGITGRGEVYCWGMSARGELGPAPDILDCGTRFGTGIKCSPVPIRSSDLRAVAMTAGAMHTCALDAGGTAYCWGANFYGEAGTGSTSDVPTPTPVAGDHEFTRIVAGRMHTCGITTSHDAYCWGWDDSGQLGAGDVSAERCTFFGTNPCSRTPRLVVGGHQWAQLSATERATCGVTTTGELYCWGLDVGGDDGLYCQMADNLHGCTHTPILISSSKTFEAIGIGNAHRCEQALDGTLECWGANYWGMFGNGTNVGSPTPVTAAGGASYASFVASRTGACALDSDGRAQCWGMGGGGQIGNGSLEDALTPTDVSGGHRFVSLASSGSSDFFCGIADTGRAYCWGLGSFAQIGDNEYLSRSEPSLVRLVPRPEIIRR
jgi:alpha-tubulin suppressor-like RCC1 family protein